MWGYLVKLVGSEVPERAAGVAAVGDGGAVFADAVQALTFDGEHRAWVRGLGPDAEDFVLVAALPAKEAFGLGRGDDGEHGEAVLFGFGLSLWAGDTPGWVWRGQGRRNALVLWWEIVGGEGRIIGFVRRLGCL